MSYRRQRTMGTVIQFPFNVPMPYQVDPVSGKLVQAPSLFKLADQNQGLGGTNCGGNCGGSCCCAKVTRFPRLRKFGLGGLGDDIADGGGDGFGLDAGDGFSQDSGDGGSAVDPNAIPGFTGPGSDNFTTVPTDTSTPSVQLAPQPDSGFSTNSDGSLTDNSTGTTYFSDGSYQTADGTMFFDDGSYVTSDDAVHYPDGSTYYPDGSYMDASGNLHPPGTVTPPPLPQAGRSGGGSGASGGGGTRSGGGGSQQKTPLQQVLCTVNPNQPACQRTPAVRTPAAKLAGSSVTTWLNQNWVWLAVAGGVVLVLPTVISSLSGRR